MSHVLRQIANFLQESRLVFEALVAIVLVLLRLDHILLKRHLLDRRRINMQVMKDGPRDEYEIFREARRELKPLRMVRGVVRRHVRGLGRRLARRGLRNK